MEHLPPPAVELSDMALMALGQLHHSFPGLTSADLVTRALVALWLTTPIQCHGQPGLGNVESVAASHGGHIPYP